MGENSGEGRPYEHVGYILREKLASLRARRPRVPPEKAKREYLAQEMVKVLRDRHSLGCYRRIAEEYPPQVIYEALGLVREVAHQGKVRKSKGAFFVEILRRWTGG